MKERDGERSWFWFNGMNSAECQFIHGPGAGFNHIDFYSLDDFPTVLILLCFTIFSLGMQIH
jgi:hypothetical protein